MRAREWTVVMQTKPAADGLSRLRLATQLVMERASAVRGGGAKRAAEPDRPSVEPSDDREVIR